MPLPTAAVRGDRRAELAKAAYELIAERGIDGLSLRALARRLGATTGLLSHHFIDRAELVEAALDHAAAVIVDRVMALGADADPLEILSVVLPTDPATIENWRFALSVRTAAMFDESLRRFPERILRLWEEQFPAVLARHVEGDPIEATRYLIALVDGIALQAALDPEGWPAARQLETIRRGFDSVARRDAS